MKLYFVGICKKNTNYDEFIKYVCKKFKIIGGYRTYRNVKTYWFELPKTTRKYWIARQYLTDRILTWARDYCENIEAFDWQIDSELDGDNIKGQQ